MDLFLYLSLLEAALFVGFAFTSRGAKITERVRTGSTVVTGVLFTLAIICAILEKSFKMALFAVLIATLSPGIGQTVTLVVMGRWREISPFSWIVTGLFVCATVYVFAFGRIVAL